MKKEKEKIKQMIINLIDSYVTNLSIYLEGEFFFISSTT